MYTVDMSDFSTMFLDAHKAGQIVAMRIPETGELHAPVEHMTDVILKAVVEHPDVAEHLLDVEWLTKLACEKLDAYLADTDESATDAGVMSKMANRIYTEVATNQYRLRDEVSPVVSALATKIETETQEQMVAMNAEALVDGYVRTTDNIVKFDFAPFATEEADAAVYAEMTEMVGFPVDSSMVSAMSYARHAVDTPKHTIGVIGDNTREVFLNDMIKKLRVAMSTEEVDACVALVEDPKYFQRYMMDTIAPYLESASPSIHDTMCMCQKVKHILHVMHVLDMSDLSLSQSKMLEYRENRKNVDNLVTALGYKIVLAKNIYHKDSILLGEDVVNAHLFDEFEDEGGSLDDIAAFYKMRFKVKGLDFPHRGIFMKDILEQREVIAAVDARYDTRVRDRANTIRHDATINAFMVVLDGYFKDNAAQGKIGSFDGADDYLRSRYNSSQEFKFIVVQPDTTIEDCLYTAVLRDMECEDRVLHRCLTLQQDELKKSLTVRNELTSDDVRGARNHAILRHGAEILCALEFL